MKNINDFFEWCKLKHQNTIILAFSAGIVGLLIAGIFIIAGVF